MTLLVKHVVKISEPIYTNILDRIDTLTIKSSTQVNFKTIYYCVTRGFSDMVNVWGPSSQTSPDKKDRSRRVLKSFAPPFSNTNKIKYKDTYHHCNLKKVFKWVHL